MRRRGRRAPFLRSLARLPVLRTLCSSVWLEHALCVTLVPERMKLESVELSALFPGADSVAISVDVVPHGEWRTNLEDLVCLMKIVQLARPRRVLELGSYRGATAAYLARNVGPNGVVVAVDIDSEHGSAYRGTELEARIERRIGLIGPEMFESDPPGSYDLAFVDANHTYDGVRSDTDVALRLIDPDGYVVWHDYGNYGYFNGSCQVPEFLGDLSRAKRVLHIADSSLAIHSPSWDVRLEFSGNGDVAVGAPESPAEARHSHSDAPPA